MKLKAIKSSHEERIIKETSMTVVKVSKRICELFPLIKSVQPNITGISTGMGAWSFDGYGIGLCNEEGEEGNTVKIKDNDLYDVVVNGGGIYFDFAVNKELKEIVELVDFLVNTHELNCSTWQDGFNDKGIVFYHSETSNQNNPFSIPNKKYFTSLEYYKQLIKAKVPIVFVKEKTKNK